MSDHERKSMYTHKDRQEMLAFINGHILAAVISSKNEDLLQLYTTGTITGDGAAAKIEKADAALFAILVVRIDNTELVGTLSVMYSKKGMEAIQHIKESFDDGDPDDAKTDANDRYLELQTKKRTISMTPEELQKDLNQMHLARLDLDGDADRQIGPARHSANIIDMVKKIDDQYKNDVRYMLSKMSTDDKKNVTKVTKSLVSIVTSRQGKSDNNVRQGDLASLLKTTIKAVADGTETDPEMIAAVRKIYGNPRNNQNPRNPNPRPTPNYEICTWCGGNHAKVDKEDDCFAVMLAKGKSMPHKYNLFSDVGKAAIKERAKEYKELGPFKDRPKVMITKPIMDHCP